MYLFTHMNGDNESLKQILKDIFESYEKSKQKKGPLEKKEQQQQGLLLYIYAHATKKKGYLDIVNPLQFDQIKLTDFVIQKLKPIQDPELPSKTLYCSWDIKTQSKNRPKFASFT